MANTFDQSHLSQLNLIVNECSKQYFFIKNQLGEQIKEIQESSMNKIHITHLIDTQHTLNKELCNVVKYLFSELSFRKCIIERKDRVLKDMHAGMLNRFIDKIYKQEQLIIQLQNENEQLVRCKGNDEASWKETNRCITPIKDMSNSNLLKKPLLNVISQKSGSDSTSGASFFNSSLKNIERFINIRHVNSNEGDNRKRTAAKIVKTPTKLVKNRNDRKETQMPLPRPSKPQRPKSVESLLSSSKNNISNISISNSNISINSHITLNKTLSKSIIPTKNTASLLNKSYDLVKKYHQHHSKTRLQKSALHKSISN